MNDNMALYTASVCVAASLALVWKWRCSRTKPPYPPGPKGLPLLGNVLDVPRDVPISRTFTFLAQKFNTDVLYVRLLTTDIVILNSPEAISELVDKRSNKYSCRPRTQMFELMGHYSWSVGILEYGSLWKNCRRLLHEFLSARTVVRFDDYQRKHSQRFLLRLIESPDDLFHHTEFLIGALVMEMTYGINAESNENRFMRTTMGVLDITNQAATPGRFLVDIIPMLKYLPEWFPGVQFKTFARKARKESDLAISGPLEHVKETMKMSDGSSNDASIAWSCLERTQERSGGVFDENVIRAATGSMYLAAVDTTISIMNTFFLAMALNPRVVRKAQEQLDSVVGTERLPDLPDQENLPYISAILKEILRWGCPVPFGVPKRLTEDDVYNGYFIPAGTTIIENVWSMLYDESVYPEPHAYDPERFLKDEKLDDSAAKPEDIIFGSGRRICPGQHFALRMLFLNFACTLSVFDIEAPIGEKLEAKFSESSLVRQPVPFKCTIRPRSEARSKLVRSARSTAEH